MVGVIEGFYGPPWSWEQRGKIVDAAARWGLGSYVYAPKDDLKHRKAWRDLYDPDELDAFGALAERCLCLGVSFGFGVSPLAIDHDDAGDRGALAAKVAQLVELGVRWIILGFDDIAVVPGLGRRQAEVTTDLVERLAVPDLRVTFVPTLYHGVEPRPYLDEVAAALPVDVGVVWTGPDIVSEEIGVADLEAWRRLVPHPVVLWDNYFADDWPDSDQRIRPYRGRDPEIFSQVEEVLVNPMCGPFSARVSLGAVARWMAEPTARDVVEGVLAELDG